MTIETKKRITGFMLRGGATIAACGFLLLALSACGTSTIVVPGEPVLVVAPADTSPTATPFRPQEATSVAAPTQTSSEAITATESPATAVPSITSSSPSPLPSPKLYVQSLPTYTSIPCGPPSGWVSYVVRSGDTLYQLSQTAGVSVRQLQQANCLSSSMIYAGKRLYLPSWSVPANEQTSTPTTTPSSIPTVIGMATPSEIQTASPTAIPSSTQASVSTATPSSTPTGIPNATISNTATALPTSTASNTPVPTALPTSETPQFAYNQPGSYDFSGHCGQISILIGVLENGQPYSMTVDMCVFRVDVLDSGEMLFNIVWTAHIPGGGNYYATKGSDVGNPNMNVTDNLGNRYDHIALYGIAGQNAALRDGQSGYGSYLFPAAQPGATSFTFHDDDQAIAIGDNVLARRQ